MRGMCEAGAEVAADKAPDGGVDGADGGGDSKTDGGAPDGATDKASGQDRPGGAGGGGGGCGCRVGEFHPSRVPGGAPTVLVALAAACARARRAHRSPPGRQPAHG